MVNMVNMVNILMSALTFSGMTEGRESNALIGSQRDSHGCSLDGGYKWCDTTQKCQRPWSEKCPETHQLQRCAIGFCENKQDCPKCQEGYECRGSTEMMCAGTCYGQCVPLHNDASSECLVPQVCNSEYVCPFIKSCVKDGLKGYTTYVLALKVKDPQVSGIYALFGNKQDNMYLPKAYQVSKLNTNIGGHEPIHYNMDPDTKYDSWITIGIESGNEGALSSVGINFKDWTEKRALVVSDGAVFEMNPKKSSRQKEYVIAQLTIPNHASEHMSVNVQGHLRDSKKEWKATHVVYKLGNVKHLIPDDCISWYDGCNTCMVSQGNILGCTRMMCFRKSEPYCRGYSNSNSAH